MSNWLNAQLQSLGVDTKQVELGTQELQGQTLPLPPAVLGSIGKDPKKKTVLIYGHFDVQPAELSDGWDTEPFTLVVDEKSGKLIGRGATDDKGPILGWLNVLQYHHQHGKELPVNLKFCFEGMEESGSEGLDDLVIRESKPGGYFEGVDCVCIVCFPFPPSPACANSLSVRQLLAEHAHARAHVRPARYRLLLHSRLWPRS